MSKASAEIDFFRMEKTNMAMASSSSALPSPGRAAAHSPSIPALQKVVSKMDPLLVKTVLAAGAAGQVTASDHGANAAATRPPSKGTSSRQLPASNPAGRCSAPTSPAAEMHPLTIFYNGAVASFHVPRDKAEVVFRFAEAVAAAAKPVEKPRNCLLRDELEGDLPIARKKSLERFLEKRKERYKSL